MTNYVKLEKMHFEKSELAKGKQILRNPVLEKRTPSPWILGFLARQDLNVWTTQPLNSQNAPLSLLGGQRCSNDTLLATDCKFSPDHDDGKLLFLPVTHAALPALLFASTTPCWVSYDLMGAGIERGMTSMAVD